MPRNALKLVISNDQIDLTVTTIILGWGSLIWDRRDLPKVESPGWCEGGPTLPLEFSRVSESRDGALTLVIDPTFGIELATQFARSSRSDLEGAISDLCTREGTAPQRIGFVELASGRTQCNVDPMVAGKVRDWAVARGFNAVIWTDLHSNFHDVTGRPFSIANAVRYLKELKGSGAEKAREYVYKAPAEVVTPLRRYLTQQAWWSDG